MSGKAGIAADPTQSNEERPQGQKKAKADCKGASAGGGALAQANEKIAQAMMTRNEVSQFTADVLLFSSPAADQEEAEMNSQGMKLLKRKRLEDLMSPSNM
eukprot:TRINITY_DN16033_c0_g1_i5.p3 TRINITY_DN16033_c0_g1~~TRINITY_DN16033_c0_g1_i5.p3  ORF type:complete len:101 (+),score=23.54 TRINITY_DN16033_c0_g1_i5:364-666(+)